MILNPVVIVAGSKPAEWQKLKNSSQDVPMTRAVDPGSTTAISFVLNFEELPYAVLFREWEMNYSFWWYSALLKYGETSSEYTWMTAQPGYGVVSFDISGTTITGTYNCYDVNGVEFCPIYI